MEKYKVSIVVGSLRKESYNKKLAKEAERLSPDNLEFSSLDYSDFPLFNEDLEEDFPSQVQRVKDKIAASDAVLFVSPEYNHCIPGGLKNAIDWISRQGSSFNGKVGGIIGASVGRIGTARMQIRFDVVFSSQGMIPMHSAAFLLAQAGKQFDENGHLGDPFDKMLTKYMKSFADTVKKVDGKG